MLQIVDSALETRRCLTAGRFLAQGVSGLVTLSYVGLVIGREVTCPEGVPRFSSIDSQDRGSEKSMHRTQETISPRSTQQLTLTFDGWSSSRPRVKPQITATTATLSTCCIGVSTLCLFTINRDFLFLVIAQCCCSGTPSAVLELLIINLKLHQLKVPTHPVIKP